MLMRRRHLGLAAAALIAGGLLFLALRPEVIVVDTAVVAVGPLVEQVGDEGRTRSRHRHLVTAPVAGRVEPIALEVGDTVAPGAVVARLAPATLDPRSREQAVAVAAAAADRVRVAEAAAARARTALDQARQDRVRAERLLPSGGIAAADVERLQRAERAAADELDAAVAQQRAAEHDVAAARAALLAVDGAGGPALALRCPLGGVVLAIPERSGRTVAPGAPLLEVGDPAQLEVVVDLLSTDAVKVEPGARLLVTGWGGDSALAGRVVRVEPAGFTKVSALGVEEQRVNVIGRLDAHPARLGHGFRVQAAVVLWASDSVVTVPSSAVFRDGEGWAVYRVEGGRARRRPVTTGHQSSSETEVTGGVDPGEVVIRHPTDRIAEGVRVRGREP